MAGRTTLLNKTAIIHRPCRRHLRMGTVAALALGLLAPQPSLATPTNAQTRAKSTVPARAASKASARKGSPARKRKTPAAATVRPPVISAADAAEILEPVRSEAASRMIAWVAAAHDNGALPYIVIDKQAAALLLFNAKGDFLGQTPVLLGVGIGDDSTPGIGAKSLAEIGPAERTTPAGRYIAKFGRAVGRQRVLWVDYTNSVAIHAVITTNKAEHRVQRLLSPTPDDNRISFGCINVGTSFYSKKLRPLFQKKGGMVYILPDTKSLDDVFPRVRLLPYLQTVASR
ncbi:hypothetical protein [Sphingomonas faeni]|uniref:hypothetical protein n=1 Tax=Sphingomonas faeni TaxID=185950 RepID=UPI00277FB00D|nr:hypothetical protein [Sphingomonas faeni]MDQ0839573.1 hypothetical protein [Sphingomonas faeni]